MVSYLQFWAKTASPSSLLYHPVVFHGLDVAAAGRRLLEMNPDLRRRLARAVDLEEERLFDWLAFLLSLHDLGKLSDSFQGLRPDLMLALQGRTSTLGYVDRHDALGMQLWRKVLYPRFKKPGWPGWQPSDEDWGDLLKPWLEAIFGHHGKPVQRNEAELPSKLFPPSVQTAALDLLGSLVDLFLPNGPPFLPGGAEEDEVRLVPFRSGSWLVAGLAVAADWLGSRAEWFHFHAEPLTLEEYWREIARPRAEVAVRASGLTPVAASRPAGVRDLWPETIATPTPLQAVAEALPLADGPQIVVVEEVTGGGKTEAALVLAHRLMAQGAATGLYFGLPTMATANAMYRRLKGVYLRFYSVDGRPVLVLAHSRRELMSEPGPMEEKPTGEAYEPRQLSAALDGAGWLSDSRKKALLAHVGVGTIDQALIGVLPFRHQSLRLLGLAGKVLIVDEVHACDDYVRQLLASLLCFHAAYGGSAIVLSATLPREQRAEILSAFARGTGWKAPELQKTAYPLISHLSESGLAERPVAARAEASRRVEVAFLRTREEVDAAIGEALTAGRCVAWIRNTVSDAREAYLVWRERLGSEKITLFHSRFTAGDRAAIEERVLSRFGRESGTSERCGQLVIATQVIEQSLDLDFDFLVSDLCPVDLIIQRAGRLYRHIRTERRGRPVLGVFSPLAVADPQADWYRTPFPRAAWVYDHVGRLWRTARWLEAHGGFRMPEDAREAIEWVYGDGGEPIPPALVPGSNRAEGEAASDRSLALLNRLELENGYARTSLDWPDDASTPTRLGEPTTILRLAREKPGGQAEPWHRDGPRPWSLSEVSVRRFWVAVEDPALPPALLEDLRASMPDEGRFSVLVLLRDCAGGLQGHALGPDKEPVSITYSSELGLAVERS